MLRECSFERRNTLGCPAVDERARFYFIIFLKTPSFICSPGCNIVAVFVGGWSWSSDFTHLHPFFFFFFNENNKYYSISPPSLCTQCCHSHGGGERGWSLWRSHRENEQWTHLIQSPGGQRTANNEPLPPRLAPCLIMTTSSRGDSALLLWPTWA